MPDRTDTENRTLEALREKLRLLEAENAGLTERSEDTFLLGSIAESFGVASSAEEVVDAAIEKTVFLKQFAAGCYVVVRDGSAGIRSFYSLSGSPAPVPEPGAGLVPAIRALTSGAASYSPSDNPGRILLQLFGVLPDIPVEIWGVRVQSHGGEEGLFAFAGNVAASDPQQFGMLLNRVADLVITRCDILNLIEALKRSNLYLDQLVTERTRSLVQSNAALRQSEEYFRNIIEHASVGICIVGKDGRFLNVNPAMCSLTGYSLEQLLGLTFIDITSIEDRAESQSLVRKCIGGELPGFIMEKRYIHRSGRIIWALVSTTVLRDRNGEILYFLTYVQDITERKKTEESLRVSEKRLRRAQAIASVGDWEIDLPTSTIWGSPEARRIYGIKPEPEKLPLNIIEQCALPEDRPLLNNARDNLLSGRGTYDIEFRIRRLDDGAERWVHSRAELVVAPDGTPLKIAGAAQDVTGRRRMEEILKISTENYRLLFRDNPLPMWVYDRETLRFLAVNDEAVRHYGYTADEFYAMTISEIRPSHELPRLIDHLKEVPLTINASGVWKHLTKDGAVIDVEITTHNLDFEGRPARLVLANDVTQQRKAEAALRTSEQQYRSLFEHANDAILIFEPVREVILEANSRAAEIYGYPKEELVGMSLLELSTDPARGQEAVQKVVATETLTRFETTHLHKSGREINLQVNASLIDYHGSRAVLSISRDVTEERKLQKELLQSQKMLSIGTLAGGIAHDFNNILNIILGYSSVLELRKNNPEKFADAVEAIGNAVERGTTLVRQILTFARKTNASFGPVSIRQVVGELFSMLRQTFPRIIELHQEIPPELPLIAADHSQLYQVFLNLCLNARDAMPHGGEINIRASMFARQEVIDSFPDASAADYCCITVADNGIGMDSITCSRIFDPFFTTKAQGKGTGLGLAVVYGIIQTHRGYIDVTSNPGLGTTFRIFFPVPVDDLPVAAPVPLPPVRLHRGTERILVVEDESDILDILRSALESNGYSVISASNGTEGVLEYQRNLENIDLVITDMGLPGMTGREEFLRLREINPSVRVILASGYFAPEVREELARAGANAFVQKPYKMDNLLALVREIFEQHTHTG